MDWTSLVLGSLNAMIVGMTALLARSMRRMRENDLEHIQKSLDRVEGKLDAHLTYHLEHKV